MKVVVFIPFLICFALTLADEAALKEFTDGNNLFTASIYKEILKNNDDNFLVSPFSAETLLALTQSGAKNETAQEIRTTLHLPDDQSKIELAVKALQANLTKNEYYSLQSANKIYLQEKFTIRDEFKSVATEVFEADLENIDFTQQDEAAKTMNEWVEKQTNDKIHNLIEPDSLTNETRAILINALYFKGNWTSPFISYLTTKDDFHKSADKALQVDTMHDTSYYNYYESPKLKAKFLEMSFEGKDVSMIFVLPNENDGLAAIETQIDQVFDVTNFTTEYVTVALPKFKIETKLDFKKILKDMGVKKVFDDNEADLSGIAGEKGDLIVDEIVQKTFVDVDEKGVEAAAASYAEVGVPLSGFFPAEPPKEFILNHPFIFYIKIKDLILFAGRVITPTN